MGLTRLKLALATGTIALGMAGAANATIVTVFDGISAGVASFDSTVTGTGATVQSHVIDRNLGADQGDFVISNNDGGAVFFNSYGTMSGDTIDINPVDSTGADTGTGRSAPSAYFDSGVSFTFDNPVNSVGFEVGDWATCCHSPVTELFISFDDGPAIKVASATTNADGLFPSQTTGSSVYEIFVAAFDDTGDFTKVSFWGNGIGEYLTAGGQLRWALVDQGSLPGVPLPAAGWMLVAALGGLGAMRSRRKSA